MRKEFLISGITSVIIGLVIFGIALLFWPLDKAIAAGITVLMCTFAADAVQTWKQKPKGQRPSE